ncbi:hypothetical protein MLD52_13745 [Puniceicoccaceae bacterium K14]|nr:hypothetical protein [Puniceicoccaceae bacterium K14]
MMTKLIPFIAVSRAKVFAVLFVLPLLAFAKPEVVDQIEDLDKPTVALFSKDGKSLFVANSVRGSVGAIRSKSYISKFSIGADMKATLASRDFIGNLTAPVDLAFSTVSYPGIAKGSLFVAVGTPLIENDEKRIIDDPSREFVGFSIYDPKNGRLLKKIDLGPSSKTRLLGEKSVTLPSSIAFDAKGNLYIGDTGIGGNLFSEKVQGRPGIWRIEKEGVEDLINGRRPAGEVIFMPISSLPGPMRYLEKTDELYITANHNVGAPTGSVFRMDCEKFGSKGMTALQTIIRGAKTVSGIQITPKGRVMLTSSSGDLFYPRGKKNYGIVRFRPQLNFASPTNYAMLILEDGGMLFAIPEEASDVGIKHKQSLKLVYLPASSGY